eukprot:scaffold219471_cov58-Attheya_sp.AAC.4
MLLQLSERYTLEERRLYHARMSPPEEPEVPDSYTAMIPSNAASKLTRDEARPPNSLVFVT